MKFSEKFRYVYVSLSHKKLRSLLTIIAVIFGIFTIVSILAVGQGLQKEINKNLEVFGPRTVIVAPIANANVVRGGPSQGMALLSSLTLRDVNALKRLPELEEVGYMIGDRADVEYMGKRISIEVNGGEPEIISKVNPTFVAEKGRMLKSSDKGAVFVGSNFAENLFDRKVELNSRIFINDKPFTVVGILKKTGTSIAGTSIDDMVVINLPDARSLFKDSISSDEVQIITVLVREGFALEDVVPKIEEALMMSRKIPKGGDKDFSLLTAAVVMKQVEAITTNVTLFLGSIGIISLIVGGLGIANTMFTAVLERTKEIGILKAIGASSSDILSFFIIESVLLSTLGGLIGFLLAFAAGSFLEAFNVPYIVTPDQAVVALLFSVVVGVLSGLFPALRASRLHAVVALRSQ